MAADIVAELVVISLGVRAVLDWPEDGARWAAYLIALPVGPEKIWSLIQTIRKKPGSWTNRRGEFAERTDPDRTAVGRVFEHPPDGRVPVECGAPTDARRQRSSCRMVEEH